MVPIARNPDYRMNFNKLNFHKPLLCFFTLTAFGAGLVAANKKLPPYPPGWIPIRWFESDENGTTTSPGFAVKRFTYTCRTRTGPLTACSCALCSQVRTHGNLRTSGISHWSRFPFPSLMTLATRITATKAGPIPMNLKACNSCFGIWTTSPSKPTTPNYPKCRLSAGWGKPVPVT